MFGKLILRKGESDIKREARGGRNSFIYFLI